MTSHQGPIFVVGSMRSGSTMLRLILDSHPRIAIGAETGFMAALRGSKEIPHWKFGKGWYERLNWSEAEFDALLRDFYEGLFRRYAASQGKPRWGEKTPFHTEHMAEMARVFPDAVFVGITRHPGAVASSLRTKFHYSFDEAVAYWTATNVDLVRSGIDLGDRFLLCRYEDVVLDSEPVLHELVEFLDEPWSSSLLHHHEVQREKGAPRSAEGSTSTRDAIDSTRADSWTRAMSTQDRDALASSNELSRFLGYDLTDPAVRAPLTASSSTRRWTATGEDLAGRRRDWDGELDLAPRRHRLVIEASPEELAERLARTESALRRARSRRAVRLSDALRKLQHGRSVEAARAAWSIWRG